MLKNCVVLYRFIPISLHVSLSAFVCLIHKTFVFFGNKSPHCHYYKHTGGVGAGLGKATPSSSCGSKPQWQGWHSAILA